MYRNYSFLLAGLLLATAAVAAGCSGSGSPVPAGPNVASLQSASSVPFGSGQLLYVSDSGTDDVDLYGWPKPTTQTGTLTGFNEPQDMCTDGNNAYIANTGDSNVLVYPGGATSPSRTIADSGEYPIGCSFDSVSGDLAVVNIISTADGAGNLSIYRNAHGKPHVIGSKDLVKPYSAQYDGSGNLFIAGLDSQYAPVLAELPDNSKRIKVICPKLFKASQFGVGLAWDGKYIVIEGTKGSKSGVFRIQGCKKVGFTPLDGGSDMVGYFIVGNRLVTADAGTASVLIYAYPKGGSPIQTLGGGFSEPIGVVVLNSGKGAAALRPGAR